jgi:hypothetical protein
MTSGTQSRVMRSSRYRAVSAASPPTQGIVVMVKAKFGDHVITVRRVEAPDGWECYWPTLPEGPVAVFRPRVQAWRFLASTRIARATATKAAKPTLVHASIPDQLATKCTKRTRQAYAQRTNRVCRVVGQFESRLSGMNQPCGASGVPLGLIHLHGCV